MHSRQKQSPLLELFSGLDYVTLLTALVGSLYGLALVYSATHSALKDGKIISSDVRSMFLSVALGIALGMGSTLFSLALRRMPGRTLAAGST